MAMDLGFDNAVCLSPKAVVTAPWVADKCRYGCDRYNKNLQCPPHGMPWDHTRKLLDAYPLAVLVQGQPPGKAFHDKLLALERKAFLGGCHNAFVLGAGPCPVCPACPEDGQCRNTRLARPSMEGSGIDVYATVKNAGWPLSPVKEKNQFVKYIGLLLVGESK
jgi:predicted metal-binding protein